MNNEKKKRGRPRKVAPVTVNDIITVDEPVAEVLPVEKPPETPEIIIKSESNNKTAPTVQEKTIIRSQHVEIAGNRVILFTNGTKVGEFISTRFGKEIDISKK